MAGNIIELAESPIDKNKRGFRLDVTLCKKVKIGDVNKL